MADVLNTSCDYYLDRFPFYRPRLAKITKGCQFQVPNDELITVGDKQWCMFHLPKEEKQKWSSQQIEEFNRRIYACLKQVVVRDKFVDLSGVVFPSDFYLKPSKNERRIALSGMLFLQCTFMGTVEVRDAIFADMVMWNESSFIEEAIFENVIFDQVAHFDDVVMPHVWFGPCKFFQHAYFQGATFPGNVFFSDCTFRGRAWFTNAKIPGFGYFNDCHFQGEAQFEYFSGSQKLRDPAFGHISFRDSHFYSRANFTNRQFRSKTDFSGVSFQVAPEFYGCSLHQDTDFSKSTFLDRGKLGKSLNLDTVVDSVDAAKAYRTLKLAMGSVRNKEAEGRFYAYEQECIRADPATPLVVRLLSNAYRLTSDYGQSITRPIISIVVTLLVFWMMYWMLIPQTPFQSSEFSTVTRFALQQLAQPWSISQASNMPIYILVLAILHSLLDVVFVFLLLLAIKRRFEMS